MLCNIWIDIYLNLLDNLIFNIRKNFIVKEFTNPARTMVINIEEVLMEMYNFIRKFKRYYGSF